MLASDTQLILTELVVAECVYVLQSFYAVEDSRIADLMRAAFALASIDVVNLGVMVRALELFETKRLDFADAYLVAQAESTGVGAIASFDKDFDRVETVERITE